MVAVVVDCGDDGGNDRDDASFMIAGKMKNQYSTALLHRCCGSQIVWRSSVDGRYDTRDFYEDGATMRGSKTIIRSRGYASL